MSEIPKNWWKLMKIANTDKEILQSSELLKEFQRHFQEKCDLWQY